MCVGVELEWANGRLIGRLEGPYTGDFPRPDRETREGGEVPNIQRVFSVVGSV